MSQDAIVIGAGHNGLVAAGVLARAGRRVLVLEALEEPGGMLGGGGMRMATMPFALRPEIARALRLERHGLRYGAALPTLSLGGGRPVRIEGARVSGVEPVVEAAFAQLQPRLARHASALGAMLLKTPPRLRGGGLNDLLTLGRMGLGIRTLGKTEMRELLRIVLSNAWDLLNDELADGPLSGALAMEATLGGAMGPRSPGTVLSLLYRMAGQGAGQAGQRAIPIGGAGAIVEALLGAARAAGAEIRTGARVARILVGDDDRVAGVALQGGEELRAPLILSNVGPRPTLLDMLGVAHLNAEDVRRSRQIASEGMVARIDYRLARLPEMAGVEAGDLAGRIVVAPGMQVIESAFNAAKYGAIPDRPVLECRFEPGETPHLSVTAQFVPYGVKGGWDDGARAALSDRVLAVLEEAMPGLAALVTGTDIACPTDIEARFGATGGHWHHGELRVDQLLMLRPFAGAAQYRMPVRGLYLCGAGAHPGGDISGAPGWNAAHQALRDERGAR